MISQRLTNRDYYGTEIRNADDPLMKMDVFRRLVLEHVEAEITQALQDKQGKVEEVHQASGRGI